MNDELNALRREIDGIDAELVALLKRRMAAAAEIAALKGANGLPVLDSERERALLARIRKLAGEELSDGFGSIYSAILAASRAYQNTLLGREYDRGGKTMICGLLGEKLGHSYSPQIHAELGDYEYRLFERAPDELDAVPAYASAAGMIYSFYGRLSVGNMDASWLTEGDLPPTFYVYGTEDPFYRQFQQQYDVISGMGISTGRIVLNGWPHGFGSDGGWVKDYAAWLETVFSEME